MMNFLDRGLTYAAGLASGMAIGIVSALAVCIAAYYKDKDKDEEEPAAEE